MPCAHVVEEAVALAPRTTTPDLAFPPTPRDQLTEGLVASSLPPPSNASGLMPRDEYGMNAGMAAAFLAQQSSTDLRMALYALGVKGRMQAKNTNNRLALMDVVKRSNLRDVAMEAMLDDKAMKASRVQEHISSPEHGGDAVAAIGAR